MIREKIKWLDPLTQSMILAIIAFLLILIYKQLFYGYSFLIISGFRGYYMLKKESGLIIENEYPGDFLIKPQHSDIPQKITSQTSLPIAAEGIKINGKVFIIRHGTNVKITKDGKIITYSLISKLVNEYVSEKDFNKKEFRRWRLLFESN